LFTVHSFTHCSRIVHALFTVHSFTVHLFTHCSQCTRSQYTCSRIVHSALVHSTLVHALFTHCSRIVHALFTVHLFIRGCILPSPRTQPGTGASACAAHEPSAYACTHDRMADLFGSQPLSMRTVCVHLCALTFVFFAFPHIFFF
jgi:hypothetical protein